jgi:hypothetical protein
MEPIRTFQTLSMSTSSTEPLRSSIRRSSANRLSQKFVLGRYEKPLLSPSRPLLLRRSSYLWPSGMVLDLLGRRLTDPAPCW